LIFLRVYERNVLRTFVREVNDGHRGGHIFRSQLLGTADWQQLLWS